MRWPWSRRPDPEAVKAIRHAQERLDDVRSKDAEVDSLAQRLREIRDANHFAELLISAFGQRRR